MDATPRADTESTVAVDTAAGPGRLRTLLHYRWLHVTIAILLIASPILFYLAYYGFASIPFVVRFAVGRQGGRHKPVMEALISRLKSDSIPGVSDPRLNITSIEIRGSLDAYRGLQFGEFDFALYQAGTSNQLNVIEFFELDSFRDDETGRRGNGDGSLDYHELQWRRPKTETEEQQRRATQLAFRHLGKTPNVEQARMEFEEFSDASHIRFVANVFSEVVHFIVPVDSDVNSIYDLQPSTSGERRVVAMGKDFSGEFAMSLILLEAFSLARRTQPDREDRFAEWELDVDRFEVQLPSEEHGGDTHSESSYQFYLGELARAFSDGRLDAAFITMGIDKTSELAVLLATGNYRLLPIPQIGMLQKKNVLVSEYVIPAGMYRAVSPSLPRPNPGNAPPSPLGLVPSRDISTAAVRCKLLTRADVDPRIVAAVTRQVLMEDFQAAQSLDELFAGDRQARLRFAQAKPEFPIHPGAQSVYSPEDFNLQQFEAWDAIYSLIASFVIATFFASRWIYRRRERKREHRLDRWIQLLLDIEERQLELDPGPGTHHEAELQALLDEISHLRTHVLAKFSAHELKEDPSGQYFVEMAHSLTSKINAKLSRQRMDARFDELIEVFKNTREKHNGGESVD